MQLSKSSPAIHGGWWLNFQLMHVVTLADDDTNSILFMTEVSVKSRRMAVTSNCVNEKEFLSDPCAHGVRSLGRPLRHSVRELFEIL